MSESSYDSDDYAFSVGDVVRLASGGPKMTVESIDLGDKDLANDDEVMVDRVTCVWFEQDRKGRWQLCREEFGSTALERVEEQPEDSDG